MTSSRVRVVQRSTSVPAAPEQVWARVCRMDGVNDELMPWMRMTVPRSLRGATLYDLPLGTRAGRSWLLLFGVVPFEYDDLVIAERGPGQRFLETSTMFSMSRWDHERTVEPAVAGGEAATAAGAAGAVVCDRITFELRRPLRAVPGLSAGVAAVLGRLFGHRHRRLRRHFGRP